jgi:DNA-binding response OmpR family regulator
VFGGVPPFVDCREFRWLHNFFTLSQPVRNSIISNLTVRERSLGSLASPAVFFPASTFNLAGTEGYDMLKSAYRSPVLPSLSNQSNSNGRQNSAEHHQEGDSVFENPESWQKERFFSPEDETKKHSLLVLLVTTNQQQRDRLERVLKKGGYRTMIASSGREALRVLHYWGNCSMVILQKLSDMSPVGFCETLRESDSEHANVPIILLTQDFDANQAVEFLRAGANDYISGPHLEESRVLLARLNAVLRTHNSQPNKCRTINDDMLTVGEVVIDLTKRRVFVKGEAIELTKLQFHLLAILARRPGRVFPNVELRSEIAAQGGNPDEKSIKSHIFHLRKRLGAAGCSIKTVRGLGYMLTE